MPQLDPALAESLTALGGVDLVDALIALPLPPLGDGPVDSDLAAQINAASDREMPGRIAPLAAALWLAAGDLDRSHNFSQSDASAEGSYWHGIMHRREGDFSNAKYWFRRVGKHSVIDELASTDPTYPMGLVDQVQQAVESGDDDQTEALKRFQWTEWLALTRWCLPPAGL